MSQARWPTFVTPALGEFEAGLQIQEQHGQLSKTSNILPNLGKSHSVKVTMVQKVMFAPLFCSSLVYHFTRNGGAGGVRAPL